MVKYLIDFNNGEGLREMYFEDDKELLSEIIGYMGYTQESVNIYNEDKKLIYRSVWYIGSVKDSMVDCGFDPNNKEDYDYFYDTHVLFEIKGGYYQKFIDDSMEYVY